MPYRVPPVPAARRAPVDWPAVAVTVACLSLIFAALAGLWWVLAE